MEKQPAAKISDEELDFLISREFPNDKEFVKNSLDKLISDSQPGKNRIAAAVLKIADKKIDKIEFLVRLANEDFRDIVSEAEYPRASNLGFEKMSDNEHNNIYLKDWEEYSKWIGKK